ncbi:MAG: glycoside hydrolase family 127 protein [Proteobacteria bacterium]|nr:glycoside hydrolase family 127 protein [Pseudomonadota bacterium]
MTNNAIVSSRPDGAHQRHGAVPFTAVELADNLWAPRQRAVRERTVPFLYGQCEKIGMIEALAVTEPPGPLAYPFKNNGTTTTVMYWDSDIAKWIEAASYTLATHPDPKLDALLDDVIGRIAKAQQEDGYFNSYFLRREPAKRWSNLRDWHELYCAGHMIEAAVAHAQATGKDNLLSVARRNADHIDRTFGRGANQKRGYCGHEEIELALVKLYRHTGERRYLDLASYFIDERGRQPHYFDLEARIRGQDPADYWHKTYEYNQSHGPVRQQDRVVGHAVRAMYLYSAMADLAGELGDESLLHACERLWADLTGKRLYVTGGLGPSAGNEGFTTDYDLPNETAYAETCAAVGLVFWSHRMLQIAGDGRYADAMEMALYNGAVSGISLDGERFFYDNPLASRGNHHRWTWHRCPCCPANIARLIASLGSYVYSAGPNEIAVHLYVQGQARIELDGTKVRIAQTTNYPWDGAVDIRVEPDAPKDFSLRLRIPGWCRRSSLAINGKTVDLSGIIAHGYACIERSWQAGDEVSLRLHMPIERVHAHPDVRADQGRVALKRGPIVYCLEAVDNAAPLQRIVLPRAAGLEAQYDAHLLGGVATLSGQALVVRPSDGALYCSDPYGRASTTIKAIPYHLWDHRQPGEMLVWIPEL